MNQKLKMTEVGWIPKDWEVKTIAQCTDVVTGATPSTAITSYWGGNIKWMNSGELNNKLITDVAGRITEDGYNHSGTHMVPENCVLIGLAGQGKTRGTAAYNLIPLCTNQSIASILPNEKEFHSLYLFHYIDSQYDALRLLSAGDGGRGGLNKQIILSLQFPLPPTSEQRRIASVLSDTDSLIASLSRTIEKKRLVKQGAMQQLLTGKTRLKGFSGVWVEKKIEELAILCGSSINPSKHPDKRFWEYSMPAYDLYKKPCLVKGSDMQSSRTLISGEVLLVNKLNVRQKRIWYIGNSRENAVCSGEFLPFKFNGFYLPYLQQLLLSENIVKEWNELSTGTSNSQKRLTPQQIKKYTVVVPVDFNEQLAISERLRTMDDEIAALEAERDKYISIKQGMMQKLLTGEIRLPICQTTE